MEYQSCIFINHSLTFLYSKILYCSVGNINNFKKFGTLEEEYNGEPIDWDALFEKIEKDKENLRKGIPPETCAGCLWLCNRDWDANTKPRKFKYILFSNYEACNLFCRYCEHGRETRDFLIEDASKTSIINEHDTYDIVPVIKDLIEKDYLDDDIEIEFAGGEPTMYYKFNDALQLLIDNNISNIAIYTNAVLYSEQIERAVARGMSTVCVSIDAGTEEVHNKLKRVVSFDQRWENVRRYCQALNPQYNNKVRSKFIIVRDCNDTEDEIYKWMMKSKEVGVSELILQADDRIFRCENVDKEMLEKIVRLSDFFLKTAKEHNLKHVLWTNVVNSYILLGKNKHEDWYQ